MTGKTFGRLTVLEQADDRIRSNGIHDACWLCECSCKNHTIKSIAGYLLKNGDPCHEPAPRGSKTGTQGLKGPIDRSRIPDKLCEHIVEICEKG